MLICKYSRTLRKFSVSGRSRSVRLETDEILTDHSDLYSCENKSPFLTNWSFFFLQICVSKMKHIFLMSVQPLKEVIEFWTIQHFPFLYWSYCSHLIAKWHQLYHHNSVDLWMLLSLYLRCVFDKDKSTNMLMIVFFVIWYLS